MRLPVDPPPTERTEPDPQKRRMIEDVMITQLFGGRGAGRVYFYLGAIIAVCAGVMALFAWIASG
jgi:hypothetical protein